MLTKQNETQRRYLDGAVYRTTSSREIGLIASRQEVDSMGEVVITQGIDARRFEPTGPLNLDHVASQRIGTVTRLWKGLDRGVPALLGRAVLYPEGRSEAADLAWFELEAGSLRGVSIEFMPRVVTRDPVLPGQRGPTYQSIELTGLALVSAPACGGCTVTSKCLQHNRALTVADLNAAFARPGIATESVDDELRRALRENRTGVQALMRALTRETLADVVGTAVTATVNRLRGRIE